MFTKSGSHRILHILTCVIAIFFTQSASASFHLWQIAEIYSNASGTVQYLELTTSASGQQFVSGHQVTTSQNGASHSFTIPTDLPSDSSNHKFLIGTQGFANLGIVRPDYVVPNGFLYQPSGSVNFANVDVVTYNPLPSNGVSALDRAGNTVVNAPTNFAGETGTIGAPVAPPLCTLIAIPAMISAGGSSTLTANCSPVATSFEWSGGTCSGTTSSTCTVTPSATTTYSVIGISAGVASAVTSATVFAGGSYDGIYQWDAGYYLSMHQIGGGTLIGTIYWVYTDNSLTVGSRAVSQVDTFDLLHGQIVGSSATMTGTRFFRGCSPSYDFTFNSDSSLTVRFNSISNSPGISAAEVDCAVKYNPVGSVWTIPRIY
jgi:hypothetical protein